MKNISLALFSLFLLDNPAFSQRVIEVSYQQDAQGNYNFSCINRAYCNYILEIGFTSFDNAKCDHALPFKEMVKPGLNKLFRISAINAKNLVNFKYKTGNAKGCLDPQVSPDFTYLLPVSPGKQVQAYEIGNAPKPDAGDAASGGLYAVRLKMKPGDTIYAARRGTVTELDVSSGLNDSGASDAGSGNYIEIVHADCSFGRYGVLQKNGAFVKPGQLVEAGQPIGLVGGDKFGRGSEARLSVYYNRPQTDPQQQNGKNGETNWAYIPLKFWTKTNGKGMLKHGGDYISEFPAALLSQEKPRPAPPRSKRPNKNPSARS